VVQGASLHELKVPATAELYWAAFLVAPGRH
jgi:hypothetical protein